MNNFADNLSLKILNTSNIIVGIDPDFSLMPTIMRPNVLDTSDVSCALENFGNSVIDAVWDLVPAVKFQSAYYERFGFQGIKSLSRSIAYAKSRGLQVILDAKRGDIGATSLAYAEAYLSGKTFVDGIGEISSDVEVDCMTINPFLGIDSIQPFVEVANSLGKGLFILVKTSNPGSILLQDTFYGNEYSVSEMLADLVNKLGQDSIGSFGYSCIGAVVGATFPSEALKLRKIMPRAIHLVPGVGTQGGTIETALANIDEKGLGAVISSSRSIIYPSFAEVETKGYINAVRDITVRYIKELSAAKLQHKQSFVVKGD
jgi:orotidine-5'-phosphate decarboxylase